MAKIEEIPDTPPPRPAKKRETPALIKGYLVLYNLASALGWGYVLVGTVSHILDPAAKYNGGGASWMQQYLPAALLPPATTFDVVGWRTTVVQTFAILEVLHALLRWVRSPLPTVAMQVASRLYIVWGITYLFPSTHAHPAFTSMVLSWSATEVIRYVFYACTLLGTEPYPLLWLRYTTFYVLYITGASSEAALIFSTLPSSSRLSDWGLHDLFRGALFCIWWPSLYVLYTYMIKSRKRVLGFPGAGHKLNAKPKSQ